MGRHKKVKEVKEEIKEQVEEIKEIPKEESDSVEIGSVNDHVETANKGIKEFKIWHDLTHAVIAMSYPNLNHRVDLRNKEVLKKIEEKFGQKIDYKIIEEAIAHNPFLVGKNQNRLDPKFSLPPEKITKKQEKINKKKEKIQVKIDVLNAKYEKIKNKNCPRAAKNRELVKELETKIDRMDFK